MFSCYHDSPLWVVAKFLSKYWSVSNESCVPSFGSRTSSNPPPFLDPPAGLLEDPVALALACCLWRGGVGLWSTGESVHPAWRGGRRAEALRRKGTGESSVSSWTYMQSSGASANNRPHEGTLRKKGLYESASAGFWATSVLLVSWLSMLVAELLALPSPCTSRRRTCGLEAFFELATLQDCDLLDCWEALSRALGLLLLPFSPSCIKLERPGGMPSCCCCPLQLLSSWSGELSSCWDCVPSSSWSLENCWAGTEKEALRAFSAACFISSASATVIMYTLFQRKQHHNVSNGNGEAEEGVNTTVSAAARAN